MFLKNKKCGINNKKFIKSLLNAALLQSLDTLMQKKAKKCSIENKKLTKLVVNAALLSMSKALMFLSICVHLFCSFF